MGTHNKPRLIPEEDARRWWNHASRKERQYILDKLKGKIHQKDIGQLGYFYGNMYPKTRAAIRRFLSGRY